VVEDVVESEKRELRELSQGEIVANVEGREEIQELSRIPGSRPLRERKYGERSVEERVRRRFGGCRRGEVGGTVRTYVGRSGLKAETGKACHD
jgi:hypothetical protein